MNAENNFLRMFMDNKKFYVDELPDHIQLQLDFFVTRFDDIYWFHTHLYEEMKGCGYDVEKVSELFKTHLKVRGDKERLTIVNMQLQVIILNV